MTWRTGYNIREGSAMIAERIDILSHPDYSYAELCLRTPDELRDAREIIRREFRERGPVGWRYQRLVALLFSINRQLDGEKKEP